MSFQYEGFVQADRANLIRRIAFRHRKRCDEARQRELTKRGWYDPAARSKDPAIFIGGCGRSGTTLFRELLNRHSRIACGPETSIFGLPFDAGNQAGAWSLDLAELADLVDKARNIVDYAEQFFRRYLLAPSEKPLWADKTPNNVRVLPRLLTWFPHGRFIHLIRDGRDAACSLRHHPRERIIDGRIVPVKRNNPIARCAMRWLNDTSAGLVFRGHPRCLEVRYEDLIQSPEATLRHVCEFLGESYEPTMLDVARTRDDGLRVGRLVNNENAAQPISNTSIGRWRRDLSAEERKIFIDVAGELLITTGYVSDHDWSTESA